MKHDEILQGTVELFAGPNVFYTFCVSCAVMLFMYASVKLWCFGLCGAIKVYFKLPSTKNWREELHAYQRVLYRNWGYPSFALFATGVTLTILNGVSPSIYTDCGEHSTSLQHTISYLEKTEVSQWSFVIAVTLLQASQSLQATDCLFYVCLIFRFG